MPDPILISAIFCSRRQAFRKNRNISFGGFRFFMMLMTLVFTPVIMFPDFLCAETREDSLRFQVPIDSYIIKDTGHSKILLSKDIDRPVSPASLTKILTCIMAIESGRLDQDVLITKEATMVEPSKAGFTPGEKIKLIDLVKAAMVNSSNDAAFAIAVYLSGNVDSFVSAMNYRAGMLGMRHSRFTNPAGFDKGVYAGNYSTAGDLLRLTEYSVRNPVFNSVARLESAVFMEQTTGKLYVLKTHNKLLDKYPYAVGIKTGFTARAGKCLIGRAIKDNRDILLVMLNARTDRWNIAADMFDRALLVNTQAFAGFAESYRVDSGRSALSVLNERKMADTISPAKVVKRTKSITKFRHSSKKNSLAGRKSRNRLNKSTPVVSKSRHKVKKQELSSLKSAKKNGKRT